MMLTPWHEFYSLLGTAAAALVALLFVAASIGIGILSAARASPTRVFTSPVLFHYTYVLFVSLIALVPVNTETSLAIIVGISGAGAFAYSLVIMVRVLRSANVTDIDDRFGYGASPPAAYAAVLAAAAFIFERSLIGPPLLAGALILLLLVNIRNAWDLTLFFVQRQTERLPPPPDQT
jgi:hypothetical protein